MTNKEFWKLKTGDFIIDTLRERLLEITKRTVEDEVIGIYITKNSTTDILNGKKYVQLTTEDIKGNIFYYDSMNKLNVKYLIKI